MKLVQACDAGLRAIVISADREYANVICAGLSMTSCTFVVEHISPGDLSLVELEARIGALSADVPTLVILDFDGLGASCESLGARILALRDERTIECIVARAEFYPQSRQRFLDLGGHLFDEMRDPETLVGLDLQALDGRLTRSNRRRAAAPTPGAAQDRPSRRRGAIAFRARTN